MSSTTPLEISCSELQAMRQADPGLVVVDCREQDEYDLVRLPGTTLIPMSQFVDRAGELEPYKDAPIVVHCHHGGRSLRVTNWLRQNGFPHAQNLRGGIDEWAQTIDPSLPRY